VVSAGPREVARVKQYRDSTNPRIVQMRLILVEPNLSSGHHPMYARVLSEEALARGWNVRLLTTVGNRNATGKNTLPVDPSFTLCDTLPPAPNLSPGRMNALRIQWHYFSEIKRNVAAMTDREAADFVYVSNLDYFVRMLAAFGSPFSIPFAGFLAQVHFHLRECGVEAPSRRYAWVDAWVFRRLLKVRLLRAVLTTDDTLPAFASQKQLPNWTKLKWIPELTTIRRKVGRDAARRTLGVPDRSFLVLCYGALSKRKGVLELLNALADPICPRQATVLLAGRQESDIELIMGAEPASRLRNEGRLVEMNRYLTDDEEATVFSAADCVWLGYVNYYGISGVTIQAAISGLPVIACREGIVGYWVRKYDIGITVDVRNPALVAAAIRQLSEQPELRTRFRSNGLRLQDQHGPGAFARAVCDAIQAACQRQ
jgi:glycosyltransferase involved in cell wall biosynthesis